MAARTRGAVSSRVLSSPSATRLTVSAIELPLEFFDGNVAGCLPEDGAEGAGIEFGMIWDSECLPLAVGTDTTEFYVASLLGVDLESEGLEDRQNRSRRHAPELRHAWFPTPS